MILQLKLPACTLRIWSGGKSKELEIKDGDTVIISESTLVIQEDGSTRKTLKAEYVEVEIAGFTEIFTNTFYNKLDLLSRKFYLTEEDLFAFISELLNGEGYELVKVELTRE